MTISHLRLSKRLGKTFLKIESPTKHGVGDPNIGVGTTDIGIGTPDIRDTPDIKQHNICPMYSYLSFSSFNN